MLRLTRTLLVVSSCFTLLAAPAGVEAQDENDPQMIEARRRFAEAEQIYERGDYAGALAEFERIYQLLSSNPRRFFVLYNMGRCQEQLFRYGDALTSYQRYLSEGGAATDLAPTVRQKIRELEARLATVTIQTNVGSAEVWVDDLHVGTAPGDIRIDGGQHNVELRARGYAPGRRALQIAARTHETIAIELDRVSAGISPAFFISGAALTAIAAGVGVGFGAVALAEQSTIDSRLSSGDDAQRFQVTQAQIDAMEQMALIADVFYGAALVFGVASIVLIFVTDWGGSAPAPQSAFHVAPFATDTAAGLAAEGRF